MLGWVVAQWNGIRMWVECRRGGAVVQTSIEVEEGLNELVGSFGFRTKAELLQNAFALYELIQALALKFPELSALSLQLADGSCRVVRLPLSSGVPAWLECSSETGGEELECAENLFTLTATDVKRMVRTVGLDRNTSIKVFLQGSLVLYISLLCRIPREQTVVGIQCMTDSAALFEPFPVGRFLQPLLSRN